MEPAQAQEIPESRKGIAEDRDFRFGGVEPEYGDFGDRQAPAAGEIEDFDVGGKALDAGFPVELAGDVAAVELESALRVVNSGYGEQAHEHVARLAEKAAVERLLAADRPLVERSGADRDRMRRKSLGKLDPFR